MIYLGDKPIGLLAILPEWAKLNSTKLEFNQYQSFDTATLFFSDSYVNSIISQLFDGTYKIEFENNTNNTRAGLWISFVKQGSAFSDIKVSRVGMTGTQGSSYGIDVYENAEGIIYISSKEVTPNA